MKGGQGPSDFPVVLALETATPVCGVAIVAGDRTLFSVTMDAGLRHSQWLFAEIQRGLELTRLKPRDISHVAVSMGPGSFTGLRIGLSAAKGWCIPLGTALVPVDTLAGVAARLPLVENPVCALLDARRGQVYGALYDTRDGVPRRLEPPCVVDSTAILSRWKGRDPVFTGPGVRVCEQLEGGEGGKGPRLAPVRIQQVDAAAVAHLAVAKIREDPANALTGEDLDAVEPFYLRAPDARLPH